VQERKVTHATFAIERTYPATPARVFHALSDKAAKSKWFVGPDEWQAVRYELDFRVGGREVNSGGSKGGEVHTFKAVYLDIAKNQRIVYAYEMFVGDTRISVSLATMELMAEGQGTRLKFTEQGAFLDDWADHAADREEGTRLLLDALGKAVA
jgi:uncharacterized protein YndB with AHSA1/START domain